MYRVAYPSHVSKETIQHTHKVTMVSPRCIPDLIASICVGVNGTVFLHNIAHLWHKMQWTLL